MMPGFTRVDAGFVLELSESWWDLLISLTEQLIELLESAGEDAAPTPVNPLDPFAAWEAEFGDPDQTVIDHSDPALARLFPNPYPDDAEAAADHRRYSEPAQRRHKLAEAEVVLEFLRARDAGRVVPDADVTAWLRTFNAERLVLATRLGIKESEDADALADLSDSDPRWMMGAVLDVIGELQAQLIIGLDPLMDEGPADGDSQ